MAFSNCTFNCLIIHLAGFLITLSPNGPFVSNNFFRPKTISKVATILTKSATIAFFLLLLLSFSSLFLFLLFFFFVTMILELLGLKKPAFWRFFTQMTANFVRLVFKKSARHILIIIWNKERRYIWIESTSLKPRLLNLAGSLWNFQVFASNIYVMGEHWSYLRSSLQRFPSKR